MGWVKCGYFEIHLGVLSNDWESGVRLEEEVGDREAKCGSFKIHLGVLTFKWESAMRVEEEVGDRMG